jgi:hypothetical protein
MSRVVWHADGHETPFGDRHRARKIRVFGAKEVGHHSFLMQELGIQGAGHRTVTGKVFTRKDQEVSFHHRCVVGQQQEMLRLMQDVVKRLVLAKYTGIRIAIC